jgi:hypothetical protein
LALIVVEMNPVATGLVAHEWLGVLLIVPLAVHMVVNWGWVATAIDRFLGKARPTMRLNLIVDAGLFLSMATVGLSGVLLIPGLATAIGVPVSPLWHAVHLASANLALVFSLVHAAQHARWIVTKTTCVLSPLNSWRGTSRVGAERASTLQPASIYGDAAACAETTSRREGV